MMFCSLVSGLLILGLNNGLALGQVNIALNRPANSSSVLSVTRNTYGPASKVVDGNNNPFLEGDSCLLTVRNTASLAWLYIDLGNMSLVHRIEMTNRRGGTKATESAAKDNDHQDRLKGFAMAVSNTTTMPPNQSDVCYKHPGIDRPQVFQNRTCNQIGRYVIIYNNNSKEMEICEVEVIGCPAGHYGQNCSLSCGENCVGGQCLPNNGSCMFGCSQGFHGDDRCMEECNEGTYGWNCSQTCGKCYESDVCNHVTGDCPGTCSIGYRDQKCDHRCEEGTYGWNCNQTCGNCSESDVCGHVTGVCPGTCSSGYKGERCDLECDQGYFGMNCTKTCGNCGQGQSCDHVTGMCPNGCAAGHSGSKCTLENFAFGKPTSESGQHGSISSNVTVDGNTTDGMCFSTLRDDSYSWWMVDLGQLVVINHIVINAANTSSKSITRKRLNGLKVTVIKGGEDTMSDVCYEDTDLDFPDLIQNRTCELVGRYVRIEIERTNQTRNSTRHSKKAVVELCEVEVIGCMSGMYGPNCDLPCPEHCTDEMCFSNATCAFGCEAGYQDSFCNETCQAGLFGRNCHQKCGHCLDNTYCNHIKGICPSGCQTGWKGETCQTECSPGFYGDNCTETCGGCVNGTACNHTNGVCHDGCTAGFKETLTCQEECENFTFGMNCSKTCGTCLNGTACEKATGVCFQGCEPGRQAPYCLKECSNFTYGPNCSAQCGHCRDGNPCDPINGNCLSGCEPGWQGSDCQMKCIEGTYGPNCTNTCGNCQTGSYCDNVNGTCTKGCEPGWEPPMCIKVCMDYFYGEDCAHRCGNCRNNETCDHVNGTCSNGCAPGWRQSECTQECDPTFYGASCSSQCGHCLHKESCNHITGNCDNGCEEGWKSSKCDQKMGSPALVVGVAVGIPVILIVVLVILLILFVMKKRRPLKTEEPKVQCEVVEMQPVDIPTFLSKRLQSNELHDEFKELPSGEIHSCDAAKRPENKPRNRFQTTFPYDHSRVVLTGGNDYINANYISNCEKKDVYVATQGPKKNTLADFWRMIWQVNSDKIVMLANCVEMGKHKVERYWPERGHSREFGTCKVVNTHEQTFAVYTVRTLSLYESTCETPKEITQFHFTKWPDHGIPDIMHLLNFHKCVQSTKTKLHGPMVVHCSAGIGRTGTFIAIDALIHHGTLYGVVAPCEYAKTMRQNRMNMIQTKEQYVALHQVLMEYFLCDDSTRTIEEFQDISENMAQIQDEFMILSQHRPTITLNESSDAMSEENISKNKDLEILPANRYRPLLMSQSPDRTNYINAVILPSCKTETAFIVTQMPTADTLDDFWAMVFDYQSTAIVFLDPSEEVLPTQSNPQVSTKAFSVDYVPNDHASDNYDHLNVQKIAVTRKGLTDSFLTTSFVITRWPTDDSESVSSIMKANYAVQSSQHHENTPGAITVVSRNGSDKCGVFCAVSNAAETLNMNRSANIFLTTRQLQYRRPSFFRSLHEYQTCYQVVAAHCETLCDYGNV